MSKVRGIEIEGLDPLLKALDGLPSDLSASVIRNVSRRPANRIVSLARKMFTFKVTGKTKRSFGILKVQSNQQRFVEVGVKGHSLAWIFMHGTVERRWKNGKSTGRIEPLGNLLFKALNSIGDRAVKEMKVDLSKVIARSLRRHLRRRR